MTSQEAMKHQCRPGYWLVNTGAADEAPNWNEQIEPPTVNVNDTRLFGYDRQEFLNKQYRNTK